MTGSFPTLAMNSNQLVSLSTIFIDSPVGRLQLVADADSLYQIRFADTSAPPAGTVPAPADHPLLNAAADQLSEYFNGTRKTFTLPLCPRGTPFQLSVWELMQRIPFGRTMTYGRLAAALGNPNSARAVGGAANKNPLPLVIPCHRVVGARGRLTGFAAGLTVKRFLLDLEAGTGAGLPENRA